MLATAVGLRGSGGPRYSPRISPSSLTPLSLESCAAILIFDDASYDFLSKTALHAASLVCTEGAFAGCFQKRRYAPIMGSAVCVNAPLDV
jgi:hypothetical protein